MLSLRIFCLLKKQHKQRVMPFIVSFSDESGHSSATAVLKCKRTLGIQKIQFSRFRNQLELKRPRSKERGNDLFQKGRPEPKIPPPPQSLQLSRDTDHPSACRRPNWQSERRPRTARGAHLAAFRRTESAKSPTAWKFPRGRRRLAKVNKARAEGTDWKLNGQSFELGGTWTWVGSISTRGWRFVSLSSSLSLSL